MARKFFLTSAATLMLIAGVHAQCPDSGVGIGREQLCNFSGKGTVCGEIMGFITTPGSWDQAAIKNDLPGLGDQDQCGDYQGSPGFGPAHVDCDGSTITGVTPPNAGHYHCSSANIVQPGGFGSFAVIVACCQPD